jgi:hypothetical protein
MDLSNDKIKTVIIQTPLESRKKKAKKESGESNGQREEQRDRMKPNRMSTAETERFI